MPESRYLLLRTPRLYTVAQMNQALASLRERRTYLNGIGCVIVQMHPSTAWNLDQYYRVDPGDIANHGKEEFPFA